MSVPIVVFVLGGPGSGKGTQCQMLSKDFGFIHLSAGDLLREERKTPGSQYGEIIQSCIVQGIIVPSNITVMLLSRAIKKAGENKKFLIDGFPRNVQNYEGWLDVIKDTVTVPFLLNFECPEEVMEARLLKRGETSGRSDDNIESIRKRFKTFVSETMVIVNRFHEKGLLRRINTARDSQVVHSELTILFKESNLI